MCYPSSTLFLLKQDVILGASITPQSGLSIDTNALIAVPNAFTVDLISSTERSPYGPAMPARDVNLTSVFDGLVMCQSSLSFDAPPLFVLGRESVYVTWPEGVTLGIMPVELLDCVYSETLLQVLAIVYDGDISLISYNRDGVFQGLEPVLGVNALSAQVFFKNKLVSDEGLIFWSDDQRLHCDIPYVDEALRIAGVLPSRLCKFPDFELDQEQGPNQRTYH